jgi:uncharacterized protein (UPF0332 family)
MLTKERINEAERNVKRYLEEGLISNVKEVKNEIQKAYDRNYNESLDVAEKLFELNISNLWVIVSSYYSMFYIANSVLYKNKIKIGSKIPHKITSDCLIVFIRNKLKKNLLEEFEQAKDEVMEIIGKRTDDIIENYEKELDKRSIFQYESTEEIKRAKAQTSLERSRSFIFEMKKLL